VRSGATDGMDAEEKVAYFARLGRGRKSKKQEAKGMFKGMPKAALVGLCEQYRVSSDGKVDELRQRLTAAVAAEKAAAKAAATAKKEAKAAGVANNKSNAAKAGSKRAAKAGGKKAAKRKRASSKASTERPAPRARRSRAAAPRRSYAESDAEDDEHDDPEWSLQEQDLSMQRPWICEECGHSNDDPEFPPPESDDFAGCEGCQTGLSDGEEAFGTEQDIASDNY